jgi:FG-GAP-like repeat
VAQEEMKRLVVSLFLLWGPGPRSFDHSVRLESVAETTANVSLGDLNGDGNLDIVLAKGRHWPLRDVVLFGDGSGHFTPGPPLPNRPDRSYSAPLADLNGDGTLDMVISNDQPDPKLVLLNDGKGRFTLAGTFGDPNWPTRNVVLSDLNGDGSPDIAVANRPGPSYVCFNDGKAHFTCRRLGPETSATILAGDMDGDGSNDLVVACRDECQSVVYLNDGKGIFLLSGLLGQRGRQLARSRLAISMETGGSTSRRAMSRTVCLSTSIRGTAISDRDSRSRGGRRCLIPCWRPI